MLIQKELVDLDKDISETSAGEELNREFKARIGKYQQEVEEAMMEMQQAMSAKDDELKKEIETKAQWMQQEIERIKNDSQRLESDYKKERERLEARAQQRAPKSTFLQKLGKR